MMNILLNKQQVGSTTGLKTGTRRHTHNLKSNPKPNAGPDPKSNLNTEL